MRNAPILQSHDNSASYNFPAIPVSQAFAISVLAVQGDGTAAGTVGLQASNDSPPAGQLGAFTPTNWVDIANSSQTVTSGGAVLIPKTDIAYQFVRVVWTKSVAGSTAVNCYVNVQSL